jgi:hypothetical protein
VQSEIGHRSGAASADEETIRRPRRRTPPLTSTDEVARTGVDPVTSRLSARHRPLTWGFRTGSFAEVQDQRHGAALRDITRHGSGFQGGEVTPLFVLGASFGAALAHPLGVPVPLLAAIGFVAVFAGATNTPLACTIMGVELFGSGAIVLLAVGCIASYVVTGERGIYGTQRVDTPKAGAAAHTGEVTLHDVAQRRRHWLPRMALQTDEDADEAAG